MAVIFANLERLAAYAAKEEVLATANDLAAQAEAALAGHRDTGTAKVTVTQGRLDAFVNLVDPAALAIEVGHYTWAGKTGTRRFVPGLHILGRML